MLGFRTREREAEITVDVEKSDDIGPSLPESFLPSEVVDVSMREAYEQVAQTMGFEPTELLRIQLLDFFREEGIMLYDYDQMVDWLDAKKAGADSKSWTWRPFRPQDVIEDFSWGLNGFGPTGDGYYSSERWECRPYERLVPFHALQKVGRVETVFRDKVKFFVSDFVMPDSSDLRVDPDPFIMVRPAMAFSGPVGDYHLVFDVWDEPGFGQEQKDK